MLKGLHPWPAAVSLLGLFPAPPRFTAAALSASWAELLPCNYSDLNCSSKLLLLS